MGIEGPGHPSSSQSPKATSDQESMGEEGAGASHGVRKVSRSGVAKEPLEPVNTSSLQPGDIDARSVSDSPVSQNLMTVDAPSEEDAQLLQTLIKEFAADWDNGLTGEEKVVRLLRYATARGLIHTAQFLLSLGDNDQLLALADTEDQNGDNLIHLAAKGGHTKLLRWLIDQYGPTALSIGNGNGIIPLHFAAYGGHVECVKLLLDLNRDSVDLCDRSGCSVVHFAAAFGKLDVLQLLEDYEPGTLWDPGKHQSNSLHLAVANGHIHCVKYILEDNRGILKQGNEFGETPLHLAMAEDNSEILTYLISRANLSELHLQDAQGNTALHIAAEERNEKAVDMLLQASDQILGITNSDSATAAHTAATHGHVPALKQMVRCNPDILLEVAIHNSTPVHYAADYGHAECLKWLLSNANVRKNLSRIDLFSNLHSADPECQSLLANARKELSEPRIESPQRDRGRANRVGTASEWPHQHPTGKKRTGYASEWPEFSARQRPSSEFARQAKEVLTGLGQAGIYLSNTVYSGMKETKDNFWSIGDLNAGVQMAKRIQDMGLESLEVVLSPPDNSCWQARAGYDDDQKRRYENEQEIARHKLALVWPGIDPKKPLPQSVKMGNCRVTFRDSDDQAPLPDVMFSFDIAPRQLQATGKLPETLVILRPYRFGSCHQQIIADIHDGRGNVLPLDLPPNSVIPEAQSSDGLSALPSDASSLGELVNHLGRQSRAGKIDLGVVYGLHHASILNPPFILTKWVNSIREHSRLANKPAIIGVASNVRLENWLTDFAEKMKLPLLDLRVVALAGAAQKEGVARVLQEQIDNLPAGDPAICILPNLPKHQFDGLVLSSRFPVLSEGANLTSFLLQHGRPHLSVLPTGQTPVAQDMGDPFEAIKAEAFSVKLGIDEHEEQFLASLKSLIENGGADAYREALQQIDQQDEEQFPVLRFLRCEPQEDTFLEQLSIRTLLEKGSKNGSLGEAGRKALLSALDPSTQGMMQYIRDAMSEESPTATHFKLQQMHLEGPSVNSINSALAKLGRYKGWIQ